jgi:dTDP-glucose 4,6-dehydratase
MSQTLLVTGGAGFIGSNFIHYWLRHHPEDTIINYDLLTYAGNSVSVADVANLPNYTFIQADITDVSAVEQAMSEADIVVHFAAESHVDRSILDPGAFVRTNVLGTQVLLGIALKCQVKRFHHISTDEVFGSLELNTNTRFSEATPYDPRSPYSASKAGSDHLVRAYGETYGLPYSITNCSNNYGEYQHPEKLIPLSITNLMEGKPLTVYGDGLNVRDWLYVQDHCSAIEKVLLHGQDGQTYVVGGLSQDYSNLEIVKMLISLMGLSEDAIQFVKDRAGHDRRYAVDWSKIHTELDWEPSVTLEEGLQKTIEWYQQNEAWWRPLKENAQGFFSQNYQQEPTE